MEGEPSKRYQILELTSEMNPQQGRLMRVGWSTITHVGSAERQRRFCDTHNTSPPFPATASDHRLELMVGPKGLEWVKWDDQMLPGLHAAKADNPPPLADYMGKFGLYICNGSGSFRDAHYQFQEEP